MANSPQTQLRKLLNEAPSSVLERESATFDSFLNRFTGSLVICGAGRIGRSALRALRRNGIEPAVFSDNSTRLHGSKIDGLRVVSPSEAVAAYGVGSIFLIATMDYHPVREHLLKSGCERHVLFLPLFWKSPNDFLPFFCLDLPSRIQLRQDRIEQALELWNDDTSRNEFVAQIAWRMLGGFDFLNPAVDVEQYVPNGVVSLMPNEVFIDAGAFDGDTIRTLLRYRQDFRAIVALEPDPSNFKKLEEYATTLPESIRRTVFPRMLGLNAKKSKLRFEATNTDQSRLSVAGRLEVDCIRLDDLLEEFTPTFVKMDIEGAEFDALRGGERTLRLPSTIWAVSAYHKSEDLWEIPLYMRSRLENHRFFLRRHSPGFYDVVCYAVPYDRCSKTSSALGNSLQ